ncbi:MAG TPA: glycosyltransferase [Azospirillaceae bacterium]|nr:glycosyltransferase [Azospirillaceae bacterium]
MALTVLGVAYPLAPVGQGAVGGAEQVLSHMDRALVAAGHRSLVVACEGSEVAGTLLPVPLPRGELDEAAKRAAQARHAAAIADALDRFPVDVVHLHGIDFMAYLPPPGVPVLATLHLPPAWYPEETWRIARPDTWLNPVSDSQRRRCPPVPNLLAAVPNGVPVDRLDWRGRKAGFAAALGRVCPEKGFEHAVEAAERAEVPLLLAGRVYPYRAHLDYFDRVLRPRLSRRVRFLGPLGFTPKRRLMGMARAVLIPSLCEETSSLTAMEAAACGTPVVAFRHGALPEVVEHGLTGFVVDDAAAMADAIHAAAALDPDACRARARARFSLDSMAARYLELYGTLAARRTPSLRAGEEAVPRLQARGG